MRKIRYKQTNLEKNIEELTFSRHWDKNWQQLKKYVSKASPHDKMLFCQVFNSDGSSCSANIVWGQLEHVRHPCVKPDLIRYHVSCTTYDTSIISCSSALYDRYMYSPTTRYARILIVQWYGLMNVFGSVLESALYWDELINVFGSVRSIWPMSVVRAWEPRIGFDRIDQIARIITC